LRDVADGAEAGLLDRAEADAAGRLPQSLDRHLAKLLRDHLIPRLFVCPACRRSPVVYDRQRLCTCIAEPSHARDELAGFFP
jgi:hypothetical protein